MYGSEKVNVIQMFLCFTGYALYAPRMHSPEG